MEATSDYWKPVFYLLEAAGFEVWLVNARDVKHLPGRPKTDTIDAVWLCKVAERGMLRPSFVPPAPIRRLRDLTRYRIDLVGERDREKNRVEKLLEDAQIKLSVVASDIFGVSGREMMAALVGGQTNPKVLARLARGQLRAKIGALEEAFTGYFTDHHRFLLAKMLARIDALDADIAELDATLGELIAPYAPAVDKLDEIPGVGTTAARVIIAEVGWTCPGFPPRRTWPPGPVSPPGSRNRRAKTRARARPGTVTATWPASSVRRPCPPARPIPFSGNATGASPGAAAKREPSLPSVAPSWSSSGTYCPIPRPVSMTWAPISTTPAAARNARNVTTSANSKHWATRSPSNPPPDGGFPVPAPRHSHAEPVVPFARPRLDFRIRGANDV